MSSSVDAVVGGADRQQVKVAPAKAFYGNNGLAACLYTRLRRDQPTCGHPDIRTAPERNAYLTMHYCYGLDPKQHAEMFKTLVSILDPGIPMRSKRRKAGVSPTANHQSAQLATIYMDREVASLRGSDGAAHLAALPHDRRRKRGSQSSDGLPVSRPRKKTRTRGAAAGTASAENPPSEEADEADSAGAISPDHAEPSRRAEMGREKTQHAGAGGRGDRRRHENKGPFAHHLRTRAPEFIEKEKQRMTAEEVQAYWVDKLKEYFGDTSSELQQYQDACRQYRR